MTIVTPTGITGINSITSLVNDITFSTSSGGSLTANGLSFTNLQTSSINDGPISGTRNRIINGDMRIDQRNAGAAVTVNASALFYTLDRWGAGGVTSGGVFTVQRLDGQLPFSPSMLRVNVTSAATPSASQTYNLQQRIEGLNVSDLAFGTGAARSVTLSFKVKSTLTGTFGGALQNGAQNRSYPFTFSIPASNTTTNISITIPGDTSGTWSPDSSAGMIVLFDLGSGSSVRGTAGAWSGSTFYGATGSVSLISNASNTLDISEVQLEPGTVATPFERRSYGQELALCERYFQSGRLSATGDGVIAYLRASSVLRVTMRATPTFVLTDNVGNVNRVSGDAENNIAGLIGGNSSFVQLGANNVVIGTNVFMGGNFTSDSEL
jgi:hypothetical protein